MIDQSKMATVLFSFILTFLTFVGAERDLAAELDQLKLSHQQEINKLKKIVNTQGKEIELLKSNQGCGRNTQDVKIRRGVTQDDVPVVPYRRDIGDATTQVAFYAYLNHDVANLGTNQPIEFNQVITNLGNLYNNTTGVFYCDVPGTYVFHVHILAEPHQKVYTVLTKNGNIMSYIYAESQSNAFSHGGNTAVLQLKRGDSIVVRAHDHYTSAGDVIDTLWSSFSGFLLYPELDPEVIG